MVGDQNQVLQLVKTRLTLDLWLRLSYFVFLASPWKAHSQDSGYENFNKEPSWGVHSQSNHWNLIHLAFCKVLHAESTGKRCCKGVSSLWSCSSKTEQGDSNLPNAISSLLMVLWIAEIQENAIVLRGTVFKGKKKTVGLGVPWFGQVSGIATGCQWGLFFWL